MIKGTFCDWLMMRGVKFHPDTVIVDATSLYGDETIHDHKSICLPVFDYTFIEIDTKLVHLGFVIEKLSLDEKGYFLNMEYDSDDTRDAMLKFIKTHPYAFWVYGFSSFNKMFRRMDEGLLIGFNEDGSQGESLTNPDYNQEKIDQIRLMIFNVFYSFHNGAEIELVDYIGNQFRVAKKRIGKEPSPFFRIINPEAKQKRYSSDNKSAQIANKAMPLHIVRGHFRHTENHPLEWFNGVKWIPAHTRGNKESGQTIKGYKIRLPEDKDSA